MRELGATELAECQRGNGQEPDTLMLSEEFSWLAKGPTGELKPAESDLHPV